MKQLNLSSFLDTLMEVQRIRIVTEQYLSENPGDHNVDESIREKLATDFEELAEAVEFVGSRIAAFPARRLAALIRADGAAVSISEVGKTIADVQSRFRDECGQFGVFILSEDQSKFLATANELVGVWDISSVFPLAAAELEEAARCIAFERYTAAVFHAMRMVEIAIRKIREILSIEDSSNAAIKNWSIALKVIKDKIDERYPVSVRSNGSEGKALEDIYASLDAIKNPWRNSTMHVENFYTEGDALHILRCVSVLLHKLAHLQFPSAVEEPQDDGDLEGTALAP